MIDQMWTLEGRNCDLIRYFITEDACLLLESITLVQDANDCDVVAWRYTPSSLFYIKSAYELADKFAFRPRDDL